MNPPQNNALVFALDPDSTWDDLEDAMTGCVDYQSRHGGKIIPLLFFAPMTEPENPDAWEPMREAPENLLIVSVERSADETLFRALRHAQPAIGEVYRAGTFPIVVHTDFKGPLATVYEQMAAAKIHAFAHTFEGKDAPSFFFVRGKEAVRSFSDGLRHATRRK
jgi:hypothetical protein